MGSGRVGGGGGGCCKGGPDNNVTIPRPPQTSRAMEESESKQWSVAEGVTGRGVGCAGGRGSASQGPDARRCWEVAESGERVGVRATQVGCRGARRSEGSSAPGLACGPHLQVCVVETHYCADPSAHCFCFLYVRRQKIFNKFPSPCTLS